jgi:hypothetical protein
MIPSTQDMGTSRSMKSMTRATRGFLVKIIKMK